LLAIRPSPRPSRWDLAAIDRAVRQSQQRRRIVDAALNRGAPKSWDFQPFNDASGQYVRNTIALDDMEARARFPRVAKSEP
jgi:choline-sulfatase